jgi:thiol-disulfide isomerase/thioredoxin
VTAARWAGRALLAGLALLLALNVVWIVRRWTPLTTVATPRGSTAPDARLTLLDGGATRIADGRGRPQVIAFWATWCPPCREELPGLERVFQRYRDRARFLAVSVEGDEAAALVREFVRAQRLTLPVALDSGQASAAYHVDNIPQIVILDGDGKVAEVFRGLHDERELAAALDRLLN